MKDQVSIAKRAVQADLGMTRVLKDEENEINRQHQDKATQSPVIDLTRTVRLIHARHDEAYKETLRSAQEIVRGLATVSTGQVNEERFFQEMRALKATLLESLKKQSTPSDQKDGASRREEISHEMNIFKSLVEESLDKYQSLNDLFNGNTVAEIKDFLEIMRDETGQRDDQRDDDLGRIFSEVRDLKATMKESLDKLHIPRNILDKKESDENKDTIQQIQKNEDLERISQEIRALKATVGETFSKLHKADHSPSKGTFSGNSDVVHEVHVEEVQRVRLAKEKCQRLKAQRDEQVLQDSWNLPLLN